MKNALRKWKSNFNEVRSNESGDIVQTILIIALFVVAVLVVGNIIFTAIRKKADETGKCIGDANITAGDGSVAKAC
jgi:hypothetical protein